MGFPRPRSSADTAFVAATPVVEARTKRGGVAQLRSPQAHCIHRRNNPGTVVVTYGPPREGSNKRYKHIALVESLAPATGGKHRLELAEWGAPGGFETHHNTHFVKIESDWRNPERKATKLLSFEASLVWLFREMCG